MRCSSDRERRSAKSKAEWLQVHAAHVLIRGRDLGVGDV